MISFMEKLLNPQLYFFIMLTFAVIISRTPLKSPFLWLETFFHEFSHGLAAIFTFGWIVKIEVNFNGSGACFTRGGLRLPILLSGYLGAVTWGALIFLAGYKLNAHGDILLLKVLITVIIFSTIMWVRNFKTLIIMASILGVFYIPTQVSNPLIPSLVVEFLGLYVLQSAASAPLDLIDGKHVGDGAALADMTKIFPEGVWIFLWFSYALATLFWLWQYITPLQERFMTEYPYLPLI